MINDLAGRRLAARMKRSPPRGSGAIWGVRAWSLLGARGAPAAGIGRGFPRCETVSPEAHVVLCSTWSSDRI
jgi:hypothetical protein